MSKPEIYFSIDVETFGPIPGENSMVSLGCAAFNKERDLLGTFYRKLRELEGSKRNDNTMAFWDKNPAAYEEVIKSPEDPKLVMHEFANWVSSFDSIPVAIGFPVAWDFMFVFWYLIKFIGISPFSHSALDIKTCAMIKSGLGYRQSSKRNLPKGWFSKKLHTHIAVDDAIEQGELFFNIMKHNASNT